jgi:hypothetical protein
MFDYHSELVISRMEWERQLKALALAAAGARRRSGLRAGPFGGLRAGPFDKLRAGLAAGLALAVHREAAAGAGLRPQPDSTS